MLYVQKDLNDPSKLKIEDRSSPDSYTVTKAPPGVTDISIVRVDDVPVTEQVARQSVDNNGVLLFETLQRPTYDLNGAQVVDGSGDPVLEDYQSEIYDVDSNGDIIIDDVPTGETYKQAVVDSSLQSAKGVKDLQRIRDNKLNGIRAKVKLLMGGVDIMINELALGDRSDAPTVKVYRDALKALTDSYKDSNDVSGMTASSSIDSVSADLSDLSLPAKP